MNKYVLVDDCEDILEVRQLEEMWLDLFYHSIEMTAQNIEHIGNKYYAELMRIDKEVVS